MKKSNYLHELKTVSELLKKLSCVKCKAQIHDPRQFLGCGHATCIQCIHNNRGMCEECTQPDESLVQVIDSFVMQLTEFRNLITNSQKESTSNAISQIDLHEENHLVEHIHTPVVTPNQKPAKKRRRTGTLCLKQNKKKSNSAKKEKKSMFDTVPRNVNKRKLPKGETTLHNACNKNYVKKIEWLLSYNADPNLKDNAGWTPLQESASYGNFEACKLLLDNGALIDDIGIDSKTALHMAVKENKCKVVELLLKYKANVQITDADNKTALDYCNSTEVKDLFTKFQRRNGQCSKSDIEILEDINTTNESDHGHVSDMDVNDTNGANGQDSEEDDNNENESSSPGFEDQGFESDGSITVVQKTAFSQEIIDIIN